MMQNLKKLTFSLFVLGIFISPAFSMKRKAEEIIPTLSKKQKIEKENLSLNILSKLPTEILYKIFYQLIFTPNNIEEITQSLCNLRLTNKQMNSLITWQSENLNNPESKMERFVEILKEILGSYQEVLFLGAKVGNLELIETANQKGGLDLANKLFFIKDEEENLVLHFLEKGNANNQIITTFLQTYCNAQNTKTFEIINKITTLCKHIMNIDVKSVEDFLKFLNLTKKEVRAVIMGFANKHGDICKKILKKMDLQYTVGTPLACAILRYHCFVEPISYKTLTSSIHQKVFKIIKLLVKAGSKTNIKMITFKYMGAYHLDPYESYKDHINLRSSKFTKIRTPLDIAIKKEDSFLIQLIIINDVTNQKIIKAIWTLTNALVYTNYDTINKQNLETLILNLITLLSNKTSSTTFSNLLTKKKSPYLIHVLYNKLINIVNILLEKKIEVNVICPKYTINTLHISTINYFDSKKENDEKKWYKICKQIIKMGVNVNGKITNDGPVYVYSPLEFYCNRMWSKIDPISTKFKIRFDEKELLKHTKILLLLIDAPETKILPNLINFLLQILLSNYLLYHQTFDSRIFHLILSKCHPEFLKKCINKCDKYKHYKPNQLKYSFYEAFIRIFIEKGTDINCKIEGNKTLLNLAREKKLEEILELLLAHPKIKDPQICCTYTKPTFKANKTPTCTIS